MAEPSTLQPEQKPKSIHDLVSLAGTIIPIIIGASFLLSICYDYFFLNALGLSFSDIPSQISDHIRSAILWLPIIAGVFSFAIIVFFIFALKIPLSDYYSPNSRIKYIENKMWIFIPIILIFYINFFLPIDIQRTLSIPIIISISFFYSTKDKPHHATAEKYAKYIAYISIIVLIVSFYANRDAREMISAGNHNLLVTTKINDVVSEIKTNGIRRFSEFSIIVDENRQVVILPKDAILSTKNIKPVVIQESLVCERLKIQCANKFNPPVKAASSP